MSKKVIWGPGKYTSANRRPGHYRSLNEAMAKGRAYESELKKAQEMLQKAKPAMEELFKIRIEKGYPFVVMRTLEYQTSEMPGAQEDEIDRAFYGGVSSMDEEIRKARGAKFVDVKKTIVPGTTLLLKSIDNNLHEFVFVDGVGKEHAISFEEKHKLLTQTDIFETVQKFLENQ